ncbi:transposase [Paraburkholderia sp. BR10936]|uniref:transposase n=1 Tax=Paraburkholderia sp. BR10936 TaxID=3236993 RepID=UPI0034D39108
MSESSFEPVQRLTRDLATAARTLSDDEARYLVDAYYQMQDDRKRAHNQVRAMDAEPHATLAWFAAQSETLENQIKRALDIYTDAHPIGTWLKGVYGIGPVIAAGLLAHIDITRAPTAGHIWRYAGLDPTSKWEKGTKRPWNAALKTLCWKAGQSFMKFSNHDDCFYGHLYRERKAYEQERNDAGGNAAAAARILETKKFRADTDAIKHLQAGHLPPAQIDARARRYAVKIFLSHLHGYWYEQHFGKPAPVPFPISHLGHAHMIAPPMAEPRHVHD